MAAGSRTSRGRRAPPADLARAATRLAWRSLSSPLRSLPDYLVIGAMKAGTTSLHQWLVEQPGVVAPDRKEVHYFDLHYDRGAQWYRRHFPLRVRKRDGITGEATPYYLFDARAPARARALLPDVKLLVMLRNPVERAYSQYEHEVSKGREERSFEAALDAELELRASDPGYATRTEDESVRHFAYLARGQYAQQLRRWFAEYPRDQVLCTWSETLVDEPSDALARIAAFLELEDAEVDRFPWRNARQYAPLEPALRERVHRLFVDPNRELASLLGAEPPWS